MKLKYIFVLLICVVIIVGGLSYWSYKNIEKTSRENEEINIELKILLEKDTYKVNESINLSGYIKNIGNKDIVIPKPIYLRNIMFMLTLNNGTTIQPATVYNPPIANNITLKPNEIIDMLPSNIDVSGSVMCSWMELSGKLPVGIYHIKAEYGVPSYFGTLGTPIENIKCYNSNTLTFEVIVE